MDEVNKIIDEMDLPQLEKTIAKAIVLSGGNPTEFLISAKNYYETIKAEREKPKPELPSDYNEVERIVHEMLVENTGIHMLDSGLAYGRNWQRNREIKDFRKLPIVETTIWNDGTIEASINIFHYLTAFLDRDKTCEMLEFMLYAMADDPQYQDWGWLAIMEEFADSLKELGWEVDSPFNSYNWENLLSQVIQGIAFRNKENEYVILQIHGGCDVRGGYTKPRIFKILGEDGDFYFRMSELNACCECYSMYTDDSGYHWYGSDSDLDELPKEWKAKPKKKNAKNWEYKLVCEKCKKEVEFFAYFGG
jgi:hypothetical protein